MSKVIQEYTAYIETMNVTAANVATGWAPGNMCTVTGAENFVALASGSNVYGMFLDDDSELRTPPTGSIASVWHGDRCIIKGDDAADAQAAYDYAASWSAGCAVYCDAVGKLTATNTGSRRIGTCYMVPSAQNGFELGVVLFAI
jgi:hypothetical protein